MRKNIIVGLAILSLLFCLNAGTAASYYPKNIIAEGDNRPDFTLSGDTES
jgi:hypothetical protein